MPEDTPVNIGVMVAMPFTAGQRVLGIQTKLHRWAAADAGRRFDDLFNLVVDPAFMAVAWERVRENKGARTAGIDKRTVRSIEASAGGVEGFLEELRSQIKARTWRPLPVRQRRIPKANGKLRSLGIPTVADRVVQACLKLVLEPIFETDFSSSSYGFRPGRRAQDAVEDIRLHAHLGYEWVFEGDIAACFDEISHHAVMERVRERIGDKRVLALVKAFLKAGVMEETGERKDPSSGAPQGGILSPLLANIALSALDEHFEREWNRHGAEWNRRRYRQRGGATYRLVRYADDFVVLVYGSREHAAALWGDIEKILDTVGLRLAVEKTQVRHLDEGFDFLGFRIQRHRQWGSDRWLVYSYPSKKAEAAIRRKVKEVTKYQTVGQSAHDMFRRIGQMVRGWCLYFRHGASKTSFLALGNYVWHRVWTWLRNKHPGRHWKWIRRKYYPQRGLPEIDGIRIYSPAKMAIKRH
ncbi:group II intron reverse transcriptase/maturase, partial [Actinomadura alba]